MNDPVNHPSHYTTGSIEVIDFIEDQKQHKSDTGSRCVMKLIFICSPYRGETKKAERKNIKRAMRYCRLVCQQGGIPFAPHLLFTQFLKDSNPRHRRLGLNMGIEMLKHCDELWVFGKPSAGMAAEISFAMDYGIPIFWFDSEGRSIPSE